MTRRSWALVMLCLGLLQSRPAAADDRFLLEGIVDLEAFITDDASYYLARNDGDPATVARLQLWSAFQLHSSLQAYVMLEAESDDSSGRREHEAEIEQAGLRWSHAGRFFTVVDVGKLLTPFGSVLARNLSTRNPLIGEPTSVYAGYPKGIKVTGNSGWFDYYAALVDAPATHESYLPAPSDPAYRPDMGVGFTPLTGLRFGLLLTEGPYLGDFATPHLPPGVDWKDYDQRLYGVDIQYSAGYFEFTGIAFRSEFEIPERRGEWSGTSYVAELKYTWTPRFYTALRYEQNDYPYIRLIDGERWFSSKTVVHDLEIGAGYRFNRDLQVKLSYRRDRWDVYRTSRGFPDGWSVGAQLSWRFDVVDFARGKAR